jgi:hypothetical protein
MLLKDLKALLTILCLEHMISVFQHSAEHLTIQFVILYDED